jgi:hypothetical protein
MSNEQRPDATACIEDGGGRRRPQGVFDAVVIVIVTTVAAVLAVTGVPTVAVIELLAGVGLVVAHLLRTLNGRTAAAQI